MSPDTNGKNGMREVFLRTIAIVGLLAVLILGAWGIIVLATTLPGVFERVGSGFNALIFSRDDSPSIPTAPTTETQTETPEEEYAAPAPSTQTPQATYVPAAAPAPALYGYPDLRVSIISAVPGGNRINVQFIVENIGTNIARTGWVFTARFPWYQGPYTYTSLSQQALKPGDRIIYYLGFDEYECRRWDDCDRYWQNREVVITADPYNFIAEINKANNTARISI